MSSTLTSYEPRALAPRQRVLYEFLYETTRDRGYQPSYREMCSFLGASSNTNAAFSHLRAIEGKGWIELPAGVGGGGPARAVRFLYRPDGTPFDGFADKPGRGDQ